MGYFFLCRPDSLCRVAENPATSKTGAVSGGDHVEYRSRSNSGEERLHAMYEGVMGTATCYILAIKLQVAVSDPRYIEGVYFDVYLTSVLLFFCWRRQVVAADAGHGVNRLDVFEKIGTISRIAPAISADARDAVDRIPHRVQDLQSAASRAFC